LDPSTDLVRMVFVVVAGVDSIHGLRSRLIDQELGFRDAQIAGFDALPQRDRCTCDVGSAPAESQRSS
jgi:hypothetical protein